MKKNCIILKNIVINENLEKNDILKIYLKGKITKQSKNDKSYSYSFEPIEIKVLNKNKKIQVKIQSKKIKKVDTTKLLSYKILILKYFKIKNIKSKTNQQYISKLSKKYTEQEIEFLLKGIIYFNEKDPQYAYVIESVRSLWNKREKIILRLKKEEIYLKNKKGGIAVI